MYPIATVVPIGKRTHFLIMADGNVSCANWNRDNRQANVNRNDARNRNENNGSRVAVRAYVLRLLSQPPCIRPISASLAWVWKIRVSFASLSSRRRRSLKAVTSR